MGLLRRWWETLPRLLCGYPAAVVVLAAHFLLAVASVREKSTTYDEVAHVTAGYTYWMKSDYRLNPENGVLPQRWLALPLLTMGLNFPDDKASWDESNVWQIGGDFFFGVGNDADALLWRARCMIAVLSVALGLLVYAWSRRLFGPSGGILSLLLYATNPTILANGSLATSDMAAALFFTAAVGCVWKMCHKVSPGSMLCGWLALSGLALSKTSAVLILPISVVLLGIRLVERRPLLVAWRRETEIRRLPVQAGVLLGAVALQVVLVVTSMWACYGFRYAAFHEPLDGNEDFLFAWVDVMSDTGAAGQAIDWARAHYLLPEACLVGSAITLHGAQARPAFLNGEYSSTGWWYFFPYTFLVKTPLPVFLLLILAGAAVFLGWRQVARDQWRAVGQAAWQAFYATAPLWILLVIYWTVSMQSHLNIGHRHILPTYPAMFILLGAVAHWFRQGDRLGRTVSCAVLASVFVLTVECLATYPHYLAYFNAIAGGPSNGYKHLIDSSLDWGQDLPGLRRWLRDHDLPGQGGTPVYLAYFGRGSPSYYGISAQELPKTSRLTAGVYCISATYLQQVYSRATGPWCARYESDYRAACNTIRRLQTAEPAARAQLIQSKGEAYWNKLFAFMHELQIARLCAYLRQRPPDDNVGYSILIYRLTAEDVRAALYGPPAELR